MKALTQKGMERRIKNWTAHREKVLDFYLRTADKPTKAMIRRAIQRSGVRIPKYVFERVQRRIFREWGLA